MKLLAGKVNLIGRNRGLFCYLSYTQQYIIMCMGVLVAAVPHTSSPNFQWTRLLLSRVGRQGGKGAKKSAAGEEGPWVG